MRGEYKVPGGKLVAADVEVADGSLADVRISGDFFLEPDAALAVLDASLRGRPADARVPDLTAAIEEGLLPVLPALAALRHRGALMADVEDIKRQRDRIVSELTRLGLRPAASDSNYVFFGGLANPHEVWQGMLDAGVLIRDVGIPGHLRVTAGTETETTAFLEALERILNGSAKPQA